MIANFSKRILSKLLSKKYRDAYVAESVRTGIAYQIRTMRDQRDHMSQTALGAILGKPQSVVSRLEDPDYGKHTVQTLLEVAAAFDVALLVRFVTHEDMLRLTSDASPEALEVAGFGPSQIAALRRECFINSDTNIIVNPPAASQMSSVPLTEREVFSIDARFDQNYEGSNFLMRIHGNA